MKKQLPISRVAANRRRYTPRAKLCALNPLCEGDTYSLFGVPIPFCYSCLNWLPLQWQESMYRQCREAKGYKYTPELEPPSFTALANYTRQIMRIIPARKLTVRNKRTLQVIQEPRIITWETFGVTPRFDFEDRYVADSRNKSSVLRVYEDDRRFRRV